MTELTVSGLKVAPVMVDLGLGSDLVLTAKAWDAMPSKPTRITSIVVIGLGGTTVQRYATIPQVYAGRTAVTDVGTGMEAAGGFFASQGAAAAIGTGFLKRFNLVLDVKAGKMILTPGTQFAARQPKSTSGLLVAPGNGRLTVAHVMANGPAAQSGWKAGDAICAIDGSPIPPNYRGSPISSWSTGKPGQKVGFLMCDQSRRSLTLDSFY